VTITAIRANIPRIVFGGGMVLPIGNKGEEDMPDVPLVRSYSIILYKTPRRARLQAGSARGFASASKG